MPIEFKTVPARGSGGRAANAKCGPRALSGMAGKGPQIHPPLNETYRLLQDAAIAEDAPLFWCPPAEGRFEEVFEQGESRRRCALSSGGRCHRRRFGRGDADSDWHLG